MGLEGRAYLWKSPAGAGSLAALGASVSLGSATTTLAHFDGYQFANAGSSTALGGDLNNDGLADLLIGAPNAGTSGNETGEVYLVLGTAAGLGNCTLPGTPGSAPCAHFTFRGDSAYDGAGQHRGLGRRHYPG